MSRPRPFRARVGVAGAASLAALSLLVTSLTPLAMRKRVLTKSSEKLLHCRYARNINEIHRCSCGSGDSC